LNSRIHHRSLSFFLFGVNFFFFSCAGRFVGVVAAWLLVTGPGLLVVAVLLLLLGVLPAWLLVTGPGLLVVVVLLLLLGVLPAWLLVTGPGLLVVGMLLLFVGVEGIALLTETSNHDDAFFFPLQEAIRKLYVQEPHVIRTRNKYIFVYLFFVPFVGHPASLCPISPHFLHLFNDPFLDPPSHQLFILCFLVLPAPFFLPVGIGPRNTKPVSTWGH
jgi:hypothetical protein